MSDMTYCTIVEKLLLILNGLLGLLRAFPNSGIGAGTSKCQSTTTKP